MITNFDLLHESIGAKLAKPAGILGGTLVGLGLGGGILAPKVGQTTINYVDNMHALNKANEAYVKAGYPSQEINKWDVLKISASNDDWENADFKDMIRQSINMPAAEFYADRPDDNSHIVTALSTLGLSGLAGGLGGYKLANKFLNKK